MWFPDADDPIRPDGETSDYWFSTFNAFELFSFGFAVTNPDEESEKGKAKFAEITIKKKVDLASSMLYKACANSVPFSSAMIAVRKSGGNALLYLQYIFRDVRITGLTWEGGSGQDEAAEKVTFSFKAMGMQYVQQAVTGVASSNKRQYSYNVITREASLTIKGLTPPPAYLNATPPKPKS
jgi:type VI protein secretion system component Hcp